MTTETLQYTGARKGASLFQAGWVGVAVFGVLVLIIRGMEEIAFAVVLALIAIALCVWRRMSSGRGPAIVGLILGVLFGLEQVGYLASDPGAGASSFFKTTVLDSFGLLAAALIVTGALLNLFRARDSSH